MYRKIMKFSALSALALTLVAWGCDSLNESALVGPNEAPSADVISLNTTSDSTSYKLMANSSKTTYLLSEVVGPQGAYFESGKYSLAIPAGAVTEPTLFTVTVLGDGYYSAEFHATRVDELGNTVDVGAQGFNVPLVVTFPYNAKKFPDPSKLAIAWLKDGTYTGELLPLTTVADKRQQKLSALLHHFSSYAVVIPE
jgi:hypothetical protein